MRTLNVAIVGSGAAGLYSAKYSIAQGFKVTIFEQCEQLGGMWNYSDEIGQNKYGINVRSGLYRYLRYFRVISKKKLIYFNHWTLIH